MTPDEVLAEYHHVIAEYDRLHAPCPIEQRKQRRKAEKQQRQASEAKRIENQALTQAQWHEWFLRELQDALLDRERCSFIKTVGQSLGQARAELRKDYTAKIAALETRLKDLEHQTALNQRFLELERRLDARQLARDEAKRGSEMIPQSELLAKIEKHQINDQKGVADLDVRFHELAERVGELEKTNILEARFAKLAHEVKGQSEIPQGELVEKFEALRRQVDDLKRVANLDVRFRELAERVGELEKTNSLEARFTKLANEIKQSELPQGKLLAKIVELERRFDDLKKIANQPGPQGPPGPPGKLLRVNKYAAGRVHYEADVVVHGGALWQARGDTVHAPPHFDWICIARAGRNGSDGRSPNVCGTYRPEPAVVSWPGPLSVPLLMRSAALGKMTGNALRGARRLEF